MNDLEIKLIIIVSCITIFTAIFSGFAYILKQLKNYISEPFNDALKDLNKSLELLRTDLNDSRADRKDHEDKFMNAIDNLTRGHYDHEGRLQTLETLSKLEKRGVDD